MHLFLLPTLCMPIYLAAAAPFSAAPVPLDPESGVLRYGLGPAEHDIARFYQEHPELLGGPGLELLKTVPPLEHTVTPVPTINPLPHHACLSPSLHRVDGKCPPYGATTTKSSAAADATPVKRADIDQSSKDADVTDSHTKTATTTAASHTKTGKTTVISQTKATPTSTASHTKATTTPTASHTKTGTTTITSHSKAGTTTASSHSKAATTPTASHTKTGTTTATLHTKATTTSAASHHKTGTTTATSETKTSHPTPSPTQNLKYWDLVVPLEQSNELLSAYLRSLAMHEAGGHPLGTDQDLADPAKDAERAISHLVRAIKAKRPPMLSHGFPPSYVGPA